MIRSAVQSENGKTFVGAAALLSRDFLQSLKGAVTGAYSHQQLLWHFIPSGVPHLGSLWEAGVKSFKTLFYKSTAKRQYTFEELATLLAKIEAYLNSWPLAPMSEDPADLLALTPGHFLGGGPLLATVEPEIKGDTTSIKEDNLPSNEWRLGKVDAVYPGSDGHVRVIDIRTARGLVKRPVAKVVFLPLEASADPQ
ncbi:uncharacterized protein [Drosophila bipectinata]|uniref:uncharacterized protein n=1 Tax=Drosophila bipectinata TaxID=42026 RepID=UPI0038B2553D